MRSNISSCILGVSKVSILYVTTTIRVVASTQLSMHVLLGVAIHGEHRMCVCGGGPTDLCLSH